MVLFLIGLIILCFNDCVCGHLLACLRACVADMLEGKGLIIHMVLATYSILPAVLKWRPAHGVVYTFAKMCVKSFFSDSPHKTSYTFQLIQISDAMRPMTRARMK